MSAPMRFMDEIDAAQTMHREMEAAINRRDRHWLSIERFRFGGDGGASPAGGVVCLWDNHKLIWQATIVRDSANFSVLTIADFTTEAERKP